MFRNGKFVLTILRRDWKCVNRNPYILVDRATWGAISSPLTNRAFDLQTLSGHGSGSHYIHKNIRVEGMPIPEYPAGVLEFGRPGVSLNIDLARASKQLRADLAAEPSVHNIRGNLR